MEEERSLYPTVLVGDSVEEVVKVKRDAPPAHYEVKIEAFSHLSEFLTGIGSQKYESREFEIAGYKWKLSLYPRGDLKRNGSDHISLYLVLSETNNLPLSSEVNAFFKLFVYDQIHDQYLTVQDVSKKPMRFRAIKTEHGFARFLPLGTFNDASNGYIINDCCIFGAEVFVTNCTGKGEVVSIKKPLKLITRTMGNLSKHHKETYKSSSVKIAGYNWRKLNPWTRSSLGIFSSEIKAKAMKEERSHHPTVLMGDSVKEVAKVNRDAPPAHYEVKIESFSQLSEFVARTGSEKYESREFEVDGYKWKLSLYPRGDLKRNGFNHISLYLVLSETNNLPLGSGVNAFFKVFVYDQIHDQYLTVQDVGKKPMRFRAIKAEYGFPRFLPLGTFIDASNGYLVNDCCIFGVEVFVTNCTGKGEVVSIKKPLKTITHMIKFSKLCKQNKYQSNPVQISGYNCFSCVYPRGAPPYNGKHLSVYLGLDFGLCPEQRVWVDYKLSVKNQVGGRHFERRVKSWFDASNKVWGCRNFLLLSDLKDKSKGYLVNNTLIVEIKVIQILTLKDFSL